MAAPRYIGKSAFASGTGALTVAALTGTVAGDVILLFVESANESISTPTGYSVLATQIGTGTAAAAGGVRIASFIRILEDAADTATTVDDSGDHTTAIKMLFRDTALSLGNLYTSATSTQDATTAMVFPSVTTLTDESLVVLAVALDTDAASTATVGAVTNANLTSITERHDQTAIASFGGGLAVITGRKATAGDTGTSTATGSTSVARAYHTISLSRVAEQTTSSNFNLIKNTGTSYYPVSDAMRLTADSAGTVDATSSGTFQPTTLAGGTYAVNFKWYWRQLGTDAWTSSTAVASTVSAEAIGGSVTRLGEFTDNETITGLTNGVEYEFVLFAAKTPNYGTNISFAATASISLPTTNNYTITAASGSFSYSGGAANLLSARKLVADAGNFSYSGGAANFAIGRVMTAETGTFSYTGGSANLLVNKRLVADAGVFSYSGNAANLRYNRIMTADGATYSYTGNAANLNIGKKLVADTGTYSYTGNNAELLVTRRIVADVGTYTYSGAVANTLLNRKIVADAGVFSYAGNSANLVYARRMVADAGVFAYSGGTANLLFNRRLIADVGTYSYSGGDATLTYASTANYTLAADVGSFSYTGGIATLTVGRALIAEAGVYSYSGNAANLRIARRVIADAGAFSYTGAVANLVTARRVVADAGIYSYTGNAANLRMGRRIVADVATFTYSGNAANLRVGKRLIADAGTYSYAGSDVGLLFNRKLALDSGVYSYAGGDVTFTISSGASALYLGAIGVTNLKYGSSTVSKAYLGSTQVWG